MSLQHRHSNPGLFPTIAMGAIAVLLSIPGCAKIAAPLPPEILIPKAAVDLTAEQRADYVVLRVSVPKRNTNGTEVTTLQRVEIHRLAEDASGESIRKQIPENQFQRKADAILSIPVQRLSEFQHQDFLVIEDRFSSLKQSMKYARAFRYAVLFVNDKNQAAGFSNQAVVSPVAIPLPPETITVKVTEDSIHITWPASSENMDGSKPARILGYNIYRSEKSEAVPTKPVNPGPLRKPEFKDVNFQFDRTYYYRVSVLGGVEEPSIESSLSDTLEVTPRDTFPPLPVENFNVIFESDSALLLWNPSPSPDVLGYRVSKKEKGKDGWKQITGELITTAHSYRDKDIIPGGEYEYSIIGVDSHGNKSTAVRAEAAAP
ncbi:MAG: fibronectin type III domain-containing protein [Acidobacteria bacterium]|nr:fibronectin type III domain-containing protein [Acidobacteriota bacterium]